MPVERISTERSRRRGAVWGQAAATLLFGAVCAAAVAQTATPLPSPLTLGQALALADETHPDLDVARADIERARGHLLEQGARQGTRAYLDLTPERVNPSMGGGGVNDSRARILLSRQLTDFGRTRALESSAQDEVSGREQAFLDARQRRRLDIMARFFDVLLADLRYAADNEEMAQRYVTYDKVRERHTLGQVSDVELLESENRYREGLIVRTESLKRQSASRLQLAVALNRPGELPGELVHAKLTGLDRELPDYRALYEQARTSNPMVAALRKDSEAARAALEAERGRSRPTLNAEVEAADYERPLSGRSNFRVGLNLRVPLYQGGEVDTAVTRAAAEQAARAARLRQAEHELQRATLNAVQDLETLKIRREAARQRLAYRGLYLDRARAIYEMEVQTTLGDAMTRLADAQWEAARADFETALAWARLDALTGKLIDVPSQESKP
jgi:outer membrane protein TolC